MRPRTFIAFVIAFAILSVAGPPSIAGSPFEDVDAAVERGDFEQALTLIDAHQIELGPTAALRFTRARVLAYMQRDAAALRELDSLRADYPQDVDYALAGAMLLSRVGDDEAALEELRAATDLAPDYEDVWRLRYGILARYPDSAELREVRTEAASRFPGATWLRAQPSGDEYEWALMVGAAYDSLDSGFPSWNNQFVEISAERTRHSRYGLRLGRDERARATDYSLAVAAERTWPSGWFAGADLGFASDPEYLPETGFSAHAGRSLDDGWVLDLRLRQRDYPTTRLRSAIATLEKYVGEFRLAYGISASRLVDSSTFFNHSLTANWYYDDGASVGINLSAGREAESLGAGLVLETDVESLSFTGRHRLTERFGLHWWVGIHNQGDLYRRRFLGMAVSLRI